MLFFLFRDVVLDGLKEKFVEATRREDVKAIVLTGELLKMSCSRLVSFRFD